MSRAAKELSAEQREFNNARRTFIRSLEQPKVRPERVLESFKRLESAALARVLNSGRHLSGALEVLSSATEFAQARLNREIIPELRLVVKLRMRAESYGLLYDLLPGNPTPAIDRILALGLNATRDIDL